jgi:hypothetical protein
MLSEEQNLESLLFGDVATSHTFDVEEDLPDMIIDDNINEEMLDDDQVKSQNSFNSSCL